MIFHQPVLLKETFAFLGVRPGQVFIDGTLGGGGHSQKIIQAGGLVIGVDQDPEALIWAQKTLRSACPAPLCSKQKGAISQASGFDQQPFVLVEDNFANLKKIAENLNLKKVNGVLFDLGTSYYQLKENRRGFSFESDYLDMRMSPNLAVSAADLVAALSENELCQIFKKFAQEKQAKTIARAIVRARQIAPINSGKRLADIIDRAVSLKRGRIHPATKAFQALRITVNDELNNLASGLEQAEELLEPGGRLVVISFHEGEDRLVKNFFKQKFQEKRLNLITKKPVTPNLKEITQNPKSRSAKLRVAEKNND